VFPEETDWVFWRAAEVVSGSFDAGFWTPLAEFPVEKEDVDRAVIPLGMCQGTSWECVPETAWRCVAAPPVVPGAAVALAMPFTNRLRRFGVPFVPSQRSQPRGMSSTDPDQRQISPRGTAPPEGGIPNGPAASGGRMV